MNVVLATYNIRACNGRDGRFDPDRTLEVLRRLEADVIALQEVESRPHAGTDLLAYLARETGMEAVEGPTLRRRLGPYGNGLLVRGGIVSVRRQSISFRDREPRGILDVVLDLGRTPARILCTHLGLRSAERRWQADRILELLGPARDRMALLGDFNEWIPWRAALRNFRAYFGRMEAPPSYPSRFPLLALDRIWVRPRSAPVRIEACRGGACGSASDHLPVRAVVEW